MTRVALFATISVAALVSTGPAGAQTAGNAGFWWGKRPALSAETFGRKAGSADKDERSAKKPSTNGKSSKERPSEARTAKGPRDSDKPPPAQGPLHIIVSIDKQRATLFANGEPYASTKISSGTASHPTPMGVFSVIQKKKHHISNLYDAPMPFMHRITWSGSALHQGALPGYPASHGCVRLTTEFAELLWKATKIGTRIIITRDEVRPEAIEHAQLDALAGLGSQANRAPDPTPVSGVKIADAAAAAFASAKKRAAASPAPRAADETPVVPDTPARPPTMPIVSAPVENASDQQANKGAALDGPYEAPVALPALRPTAADAPAVATSAPVPAPGAPVPKPEQASKISSAIERMRSETKDQAPPRVLSEQTVKPAETVVVQVPPKRAEAVMNAPAAPKPAEVIVALPPADKSAAPVAIEAKPAESKPSAPIIVEERPATKPASAAPAPAIDTPVVISLPPAPPAAAPREVNRKPVSLFVSLKDRKLYARQGMESLFEMPISIADTDRPLGTHVFTAMGTKNSGGLRWTVISIPSKERPDAAPDDKPRKKKNDDRTMKPVAEPLPSPAAALDRIVMPSGALERIAGLVVPGASLIVSDNRLSDEASNATEFIVMTR